MTLGFYYHIPIKKSKNEMFLPGFLAVFLEQLALNVNNLVLLLHEGSEPSDLELCDVRLKGTNIKWVNIGRKKSAWKRSFLSHQYLKKYKKEAEMCDIILVRGPSPLAYEFYNAFNKFTTICYLIVGDYSDSAKFVKVRRLKDLFIKGLFLYNSWQLKRAIFKTITFVNSQLLFDRYKEKCTNLFLTSTSTISKNDLYEREDTCLNNTYRILYTGRLELIKGLKELVSATSILKEKGFKIELNIAGWEDGGRKIVEEEITDMVLKLGLKKEYIFHGKLRLGEDLNNLYRSCDIFVMPSYHEGFPRVIWEAMANALPVISTKVGGIPAELKDGVNALLINPKSSNEIAEGIERLINSSELRSRLIKNGRVKVAEKTIEYQTKTLINKLKSNI